MATQAKVAVLIGSLRKESLTRRFAHALIGIAGPGLALEIVEIGTLPLYNPDIEDNAPPAWAAFRKSIQGADAVLFMTPEYNRSVPAALKNALDVGSRPYGQSVWNGKPGAVISVSPGAMGAFGANHHLRQSLVFLNVPAMQQPEAYVGGVEKLLTDDNQFANDGTKTFMTSFLAAFEQWIAMHRGG